MRCQNVHLPAKFLQVFRQVEHERGSAVAVPPGEVGRDAQDAAKAGMRFLLVGIMHVWRTGPWRGRTLSQSAGIQVGLTRQSSSANQSRPETGIRHAEEDVKLGPGICTSGGKAEGRLVCFAQLSRQKQT